MDSDKNILIAIHRLAKSLLHNLHVNPLYLDS